MFPKYLQKQITWEGLLSLLQKTGPLTTNLVLLVGGRCGASHSCGGNCVTAAAQLMRNTVWWTRGFLLKTNAGRLWLILFYR